jgi:hypothetical protein
VASVELKTALALSDPKRSSAPSCGVSSYLISLVLSTKNAMVNFIPIQWRTPIGNLSWSRLIFHPIPWHKRNKRREKSSLKQKSSLRKALPLYSVNCLLGPIHSRRLLLTEAFCVHGTSVICTSEISMTLAKRVSSGDQARAYITWSG